MDLKQGIFRIFPLLLLPFLTACSDEIKPWSTKNEVVIHVAAEPKSLHPTNDSSTPKVMVTTYTQMYLLAFDVKTHLPSPMLVDSMPLVSEDALRYTYVLRDDVKWDDGSQLSVDDVIFSYKASKCILVNNPGHKPYVENLIGIEKDARYPLRFTMVMKRPYIQNIDLTIQFPIIQASWYDPQQVVSSYSLYDIDTMSNSGAPADIRSWAEWFNDPTKARDKDWIQGLGPYKYVSWVPDQELVLERKTNHWTDQTTRRTPYESANPDKIIFRINKEKNSQMLSLLGQDYDVTTSVGTTTLKELLEDEDFTKNYNVEFITTYSQSYIGMNMKPDGIRHPKVFDDIRVRKAFSHVVPYQAINRVLKKGMAKRSLGPVYPIKQGYDTTLVGLDYDIDRAKELLAEAGWEDTDNDEILDKEIDGRRIPLKVSFSHMSGAEATKDLVNMIIESGRDVGMDIEPRPLEFSKFYENAMKHDFDLMLAGWGGDPSLDDQSQLWHTEQWTKNGYNFCGFGNSQTDALIDSMKRQVLPEKYHPISYRFQQAVVEQAPYVFLFAGLEGVVTHKRFTNQMAFPFRSKTLAGHLKLATDVRP